MNPLRVLVLGNHAGAYRSAEVVRCLLADPARFRVHLLDPMDRCRLNPVIRAVHLGIGVIHALCWAQAVYITPMQHGRSRSMRIILRILRLAGRREICDYYISLFESHLERHGEAAKDAPEARRLMDDDRAALAHGRPVIFLNQAEQAHYQRVASFEVPPGRSAIAPLVVPDRPAAALPHIASGGGELNIFWWGLLGNPLHGIPAIIDALAIAARERPGRFRIVFAAAGKEPELAALSDLIASRGLAGIAELDRSSTFANGRLLERLATEADLALGVFGGTAKATTVATNKVFDALSMGIPCITGTSAGISELFRPGELVTCAHDAQALASTLVLLADDSARLVETGRRGRAAIAERFSTRAFQDAIHRAFAAS